MFDNVDTQAFDHTDQFRCFVCPHACFLREGQVGLCRARRGSSTGVVSQSYGKITSLALDPIEKKPLARFMPGSKILSVGSFGCNLCCPFLPEFHSFAIRHQ